MSEDGEGGLSKAKQDEAVKAAWASAKAARLSALSNILLAFVAIGVTVVLSFKQAALEDDRRARDQRASARIATLSTILAAGELQSLVRRDKDIETFHDRVERAERIFDRMLDRASQSSTRDGQVEMAEFQLQTDRAMIDPFLSAKSSLPLTPTIVGDANVGFLDVAYTGDWLSRYLLVLDEQEHPGAIPKGVIRSVPPYRTAGDVRDFRRRLALPTGTLYTEQLGR